LPASLAGPVALAEAFIRIHRGDPATGNVMLEQAARINPDLALLNLGRATARARTGDFDGAIAAADAFAANYGDDLGVLIWHGFALEEQGKSDDAARFYDRALNEDPNSLLALNGLRRTRGLLPELLEHTARTRGPLATYGFLKRASAADGLPFSAAWAEQTEPAGFDFIRDLARAQRVDDMYRDKLGMQAYKKVGPVERTFDQLAGNYVRDGDAAGLKKLIAAHDTLFPHDPWLDHWQGELNVLNGEFETAAGFFRAFSRNPAASPADRYTAAALVVKTWVRARDAAKAKEAVNEIGPEWLPVGVRASALALAGDTAGVECLMAARAHAPGGLTPFYADPDFSRLVATGTFADLRKKYPR
jgi:predicted Zn-dependent protease